MSLSLLHKIKLRTRLLLVYLTVCVVFAVAVWLILNSYTDIRRNIDSVVEHGVEAVTANAETGRDFSLLFTDTAVLAENFIDRDDLLKSRGKTLKKRARELDQRSLDPDLKLELATFSGLLDKVLSLCRKINDTQHTLTRLDGSVLKQLARLREALSPGEPSMASADDIARSFLEMRALRAELNDRDFTSGVRPHPLFEGLNGLESAVGDIETASTEANAARDALSESLAAENETLEQYFLLRKQLVSVKGDLHFAMDRTMALLGSLDTLTREAAVDVRDGLGSALAHARDLILILFAAVLLVSGLLTTLFFRNDIDRPMAALCAAAEEIGKKHDARVNLGREDEWNQVEIAMNAMADELARKAHELHSKNKDLHSAHATLESKITELHDQIEARAVAELKARTLNTELERRVTNRTAELETAFKELESLSYSIAHDLRQPLRSIDGFSHALLEDYGDQLDEEGCDHLKRVRASVQQLGQLFDDFQHLTSVTRAKMRRSRFDFTAVALEVGNEMRSKYPDREVEFHVQEDLIVVGDRHLLRLALTHLLDNAWKFTKNRQPAVIHVGSSVEENGEVLFVRDNGEGFDMRYAHKLFGPMNRLHSPEEFGGGGLGLAVIQRVIQRHNGRIRAEGEKGKGAVFLFTLQDGSTTS